MNLLFSLSLSAFFTEGPRIGYDRPIFDNFGPSVPRRAASPVKLQKRNFFLMFYVMGLHFGTGMIGVNLTHFVNKHPILHGGR